MVDGVAMTTPLDVSNTPSCEMNPVLPFATVTAIWQNALSPIDVTVDGSCIASMAVFRKASAPMVLSPSLSSSSVSAEQPLKAPLPISVSDAETVNDVICEQPLKAFLPISATAVPLRSTDAREEQSANA